MKQTLIFFAALISISSFAQSRKNSRGSSGSSLEQGTLIFSAGYGVGNLSKAFFNAVVDAANIDGFSIKTTGPFFIKGEYAVTDNIGLGLNIATITNKSSQFDFNYTDPNTGDDVTARLSLKRPNTSIMARANFYFVNEESFQMYGGFGLGLRLGGIKITGQSKDIDQFNQSFSLPLNPFGFEATLGARYFFIPNLGIYAEVGAAKGLLQFGVSGKF